VTHPLRSLVVAALLACALAAPAARAAAPETGIADDRVLLAGGPQADQAVTAWAALGVDTVRIHAFWGRIAPAADAAAPPAGFAAADPSDPRYDWGALDAAVDRVRAAGMRVMLTVTGPGPVWTSTEPSRRNPRWKPDPRRFADFATAVARRYGDRVDRYIVWNEPNLPLWLQPQSTCTGGRCTPASPRIYRDLVRAAEPAIKAADPGAQVLIGALGPRGAASHSANANLRPLEFLRWMACVNGSYRPIRTGPCAGFHSAAGDGFAYHPHGVLNAPGAPFANPDDVDLASLPRLEAVLDRLQRLGRLRKLGGGPFGLYLDEYGYQTNPPDRFLGVSAATQDRWLQEAAYRVWRDPRVRNLTQYGWIDEPGAGGNYGGWQSGLRYADGRAKPALAHFATPFFLDAARGRLWGQVRPGPGGDHVTIERRLRGGSAWRAIGTATTDGSGVWTRTVRLVRGASYRFTAGDRASAAMTR
jgi:Cellulase (glycosyl hydrolase family 5)